MDCNLVPFVMRLFSLHASFILFQVKTCYLPPLPRHRELVSQLGPIHTRLAFEGSIAKKHPTYRCNEAQVITDPCN